MCRFVRYLHQDIDWSARLIAILGSRGVGKTTLMLQHIRMVHQPGEALYVTAESEKVKKCRKKCKKCAKIVCMLEKSYTFAAER